jgi:hypothetical protein
MPVVPQLAELRRKRRWFRLQVGLDELRVQPHNVQLPDTTQLRDLLDLRYVAQLRLLSLDTTHWGA